VAALDLNGKVALVTGAARGIGFETSRLLHERGASVAVLDLDLAAAREAADAIGQRTLAIDADVTDRAAMVAAVGAVTELFGGLDIAVANAGVAPPARPMATIDPDAFERTIEVDLLGVWRTVRAVLPEVIARRGHIVVLGSIYSFANGALATPYAASKAGVEQLGRALRVELAPHGATAGVAYFGFIDTGMVRETFADPVAQRVEDVFPKFVLRRLKPADAGAAIVAGIERRAPRIVAPPWLRAFSALRGLLNPLLDARMVRDTAVHETVRQGEASGPR
jgi:NAD(P)-dependent dehydrogenase (short-subunit alcohol dehydrogenase family)